MLRLLLLVPCAILLAGVACFVTLLIAAVAMPELGRLLTDSVWRATELIINDGLHGNDVERWLPFLLSGWQLLMAVMFAPAILIAIISEAFALRSFVVQCATTVVLSVLIPLALLPKTASGGIPPVVLAALASAGLVAGAVYWLVAGRGAGRGSPTPPPAAAVRSGS